MKNRILISLLLVLVAATVLLQLFVLREKPPQEAEGWISDIAYNLNREFTGTMGRGMPWGGAWAAGMGRLFILAHHFIYKIVGVGVFQARILSFISGYLLLILMFRWVRKYVSVDAAFFSAALLFASPSWWSFLANARYDVTMCLLAFTTFYLISSGIVSGKSSYFLSAGFFAALSVNICYRGIETVICAVLFGVLFFKKKTFTGYSLAFLAGSFIAFVIWCVLEVIPMGLSNFTHHILKYAVNDGGSYTYSGAKIFSELFRFARYSAVAAHLTKIEIIYWLVLLGFFYKYRSKYRGSSVFVLRWLFACFVVMSLVENPTYPSYVLMYSPFICILCGIGLRELFVRKRILAYSIFIFVMLFGLAGNAARAGVYFYHEHVRGDYRPKEYSETLRASVDLKENVLGDVTNWFAFRDARYYGGSFYLSRMQQVFHEFRPAAEYGNDLERSAAMLDFFKRKEIRFLIANSSLKKYISDYFPRHLLPGKNFELAASLEDYYLGGEAYGIHPVKTEVYKVVSYENQK